MSPDLVSGLECLRKTGTAEQKAAFMDGSKSAVYEYPAGCKAAARP